MLSPSAPEKKCNHHVRHFRPRVPATAHPAQEAHIEATDNADAQKLLRFIAKDEKEHYALFQELIRRLDPQQAEEMDNIGAKLDVILSTPSGLEASEEAVDAAGAAGSAQGSNLSNLLEERERLRQPTVGSLFGQLQG